MDTSKEVEGGGGDKRKEEKQQSEAVRGGGGGGGPIRKGKSCKGYIYYSSSLKSHNRNPRCIGLPRTLQQVPNSAVGQSKDGQTLLDFYYACAGYSIYATNVQDVSTDNKQTKKTELPVCVGLELLVDRKVNTGHTAPAPSTAHTRACSKEEVQEFPQPRVHNKPAHSSGDDFLSRFTRSANVVAWGVARNLLRVGNHVKESIDDILFPHRKRPK